MKNLRARKNMISSFKSTLLLFSIILLFTGCRKENIDSSDIAEDGKSIKDLTSEKQAILTVMKKYKDALQNLTTNGTFELFTPDATVFEQGKVEGTYEDYINHHLGPELGHFKSFIFSDYNIDVTVNLPYAFATENYLYTIVLKGDESEGNQEQTIESKGVATSILKKINGEFKIIHTHSSFKKLKQ